MSAQKIQANRAIVVVPSDTVDIPYPNLVKQGSATSTTANLLVDATGDFVVGGIKIGDTILNITTNLYATVVNVNNATDLLVSDNIFTSGDAYAIYQGENYGSVLYVGAAGDVSVETIGGDLVVFVGVNAGQFLPVQVRKVLTATSATNILALW